MKKKIAYRKLRTKCIYCDKGFNKGEVYYSKREVTVEDGKVIAYEYKVCPRCKYTREQREIRFNEFKKRCKHPEEFQVDNYGYIPGECIKQIEYSNCMLCGKTV